MSQAILSVCHVGYRGMASEEDLVRLAVFLSVSYGAGKVAEQMKVSPIIAFIAVGAFLGPPLADFVPIPNGLILSGLLGIQLSVIDAGLGTDLEDLRQSAFRAVIVAILGVIFPLQEPASLFAWHDRRSGRDF